MHFISVDTEMLPVYLGETEKTIPDKQFLPLITGPVIKYLLLNICSFACY